MILRALILLLCASSLALGQDAKVRASIGTQGELWVGQRVTLIIELLAPGFFSGAPSFDLPTSPGLLLVPPTGSPVVSSETIEGTSYTVQRHEAAIFARRAGEQTIPAIPIRIHFKRNPLDKDAVAETVKTEPLRFTAKLPPGAENLGNVISARDLKVEETWKPEPGKAKAGDAFTRTISFTAPDVPAMAFPPFPAGQIDGLGVYPKPPEVLDESGRGSLIGKRRDTITYVCQHAGQFTIPGARLTWFDLDAKGLRTIEFAARTFDVAPNPALGTDNGTTAHRSERHSTSAWIITALVAVLAALLSLAAMRASLVRFLEGILEPLRPVHLQPLNPPVPIKAAPTKL
jgi:hypothetical protein